MLQRFLFFAVISSLLSAYTYFGGANCPTKSIGNSSGSVRNLTCSSCHSSTTVDPIISDGRTLEGDVVAFDIFFPGNVSALSLALYVNDNLDNKFSSTTAGPTEITTGLGAQLLYELTPVKSAKTATEMAPVTFLWEAPQHFTTTQTIKVQGVLSNLDGTSEGTYAFEKTIYVSPSIFNKPEQELKLYPSVASAQLEVVGFQDEITLIRVINILGTTVYQSSVAQYTNLTIDVANFENGNYFLLVGEGKNQETLRFVVQK